MLTLLLLLAQDEFRTVDRLETVEWPEAPRQERPRRGYLGVTPDRDFSGPGVRITEVAEGGPSAEAGMEAGDVIAFIGDHELNSYRDLLRALGEHEPGTSVTVGVLRGEDELELSVNLGDPESAFGMRMWTQPTFHLAVILIEFPDVRHNPDIPASEYARMLFSRSEYTGLNVSGERVYGSLADYYRENSGGRLEVTGRVFDWVECDAARERLERSSMGGRLFRDDFLGAAMDRIREREGADALDGFDGVIVLHAGAQSHYRPRALWPHRSNLRLGDRRVPYYLADEGGRRIGTLGVHVHEFGHMLGLPDQYGDGHSTGIGKWCVMAVGHMGGGDSRNHRPFHLCAWCKVRLGWATTADVDPRTRQAVVLEPVENDGAQVVRVLANPDGTEYFLLENRQRVGFDKDLDAPGLLIWRVRERGRGAGVDLVEAHGLDVPNASLVETEEIPFPSVYNEHFTPDTFPSSGVAAGLPVYITGIESVDGRIRFRIGEEIEARTWEPPLGGYH